MAPVARPDPASFDKALVERGRVLANYGDCTACHTRPDGAPFAGNFPLKTPFGTIYTSNITPDTETGIGTWSKEAFRRSLKDGVDRKGHHLYPAFPYDHFTKVKDADIDAIYAYLMARSRRCGRRRAATISAFPSTSAPRSRSGRRCSSTRPRSRLIHRRMPRGTRAPIWSKVSAIAPPATARATSWVRARRRPMAAAARKAGTRRRSTRTTSRSSRGPRTSSSST